MMGSSKQPVAWGSLLVLVASAAWGCATSASVGADAGDATQPVVDSGNGLDASDATIQQPHYDAHTIFTPHDTGASGSDDAGEDGGDASEDGGEDSGTDAGVDAKRPADAGHDATKAPVDSGRDVVARDVVVPVDAPEDSHSGSSASESASSSASSTVPPESSSSGESSSESESSFFGGSSTTEVSSTSSMSRTATTSTSSVSSTWSSSTTTSSSSTSSSSSSTSSVACMVVGVPGGTSGEVSCSRVDSGACMPGSLVGYTPPTPPPPATPNPVCSAADIQTIYNDCLNGGACDEMNVGNPLLGCFDCIFTNEASSPWGPVVQTEDGVASLNYGGCLQLLEPCNTACANTFGEDLECEQQACGTTCPVTDETSLVNYENCADAADSCGNAGGSGPPGCYPYAYGTVCSDYITGSAHPGSVCFAAGFSDFAGGFLAIAGVFCGNGS